MAMIRRSFRFFGKLLYAIRKDSTDAAAARGNLLEIFHAREAEGMPYRSFARVTWLEEGATLPAPPNAADTPDPLWTVFTAGGRDLITEALATQHHVHFWICKPPGGGTGGRRLHILNIACFDQFQNSAATSPTERFPLVATYSTPNSSGKTVERFSRVTFGHGGPSDSKFNMRLELAFALPVGFGSAAKANTVGGGQIGMGGVFPTTRDAENFVMPAPLLLGPSEATEIPSASYVLGSFGVSAETGTDRFVKFKSNSNVVRFDGILKAAGFDAVSYSGDPSVVEILSAQNGEDFDVSVACRQKIYPDKKAPSVEPDGFSLPKQLGARLHFLTNNNNDTPQPMVAEAYLVTNGLSDSDLVSALHRDGTQLKSTAYANLRWKSRVTNGGLAGGGDATIDGDLVVLRGGGLEEALRTSRIARGALVATDRQPQSALPSMKLSSGSGENLNLLGHIRGLKVSHSFGGAPQVELDGAAPARLGVTPDTLPLDYENYLEELHTPKGKAWQRIPVVGKPVRFEMRLPVFNRTLVDPDESAYPIVLARDRGLDTDSDDSGEISFAIWNDKDGTHSDGLAARLGSLAFERGPGKLLDDERHSRLVIRRRDRQLPDKRDAAKPAPAVDVEWQWSFQIDTAEPVTTDIPHGDRDERPSDLLIREAYEAAVRAAVSPFRLDIIERLRDDQDRELTAELHERSDQTGTATFAVLTDTPFSVYRFTRQQLSSGSASQTDAVATYDSDEQEWRLLQVNADGYVFQRPPGAVGEDADKPGMLELHDPVRRLDSGTPLRPVLPRDLDAADRRHVVDTRLSPPTTLWVEPSDLKRNYYLPEYAGRELFRQRGDFGLGMKLVALRGEFVYGLATGLLVPPDSAGQPGPRVAEIEALMGRMVAPSNEDGRRRFKRLRRAFERRAERLEIWTLDARASNPFVPARFDTGLSFALRNTALLAPPVRSDRVQPDTNTAGLRPPRFHPRGLSGGAVWPIESANIARVLAQDPQGTGGSLGAVALSPMGLSGDQTVRFLNGYISIITETRDGHLQRQRVEILGRIGALWHRAKHVVIYERTTAPSPQFAPFPHQPSRTRRPVLRKVEEFVEILEPSRRYPDMPEASLRSRGFCEEVRFNSRVIHVNSAWGRDVGTESWEVPLWNRGEAEQRPQIYPHPDIAFLTSAEGNSDGPLAVQECLDAANVYFYTDPAAAQKIADTNRWPARNGVDMSVLGTTGPVNFVQLIMTSSEGTKGAFRRPAPSRILPGLRRFTWRLAPSATRTRLNAERGAKPIFAGIESVTLMRGPGSVELPGHLQKAIKEGIEEKTKLPQLVRKDFEFRRKQDREPLGFGKYDAVLAAHDELAKAGVNATLDQLKALKNAATDLANLDAVKDLDKFIGKDGQSVLDKASNVLADAKDIAQNVKTFDADECAKIADRATGTIRQRKLLCLQMLRHAESETLAIMATLSFGTGQELKDWLRAELRNQADIATRDLFEQAASGLGVLRGSIAIVRAVIGDWRTDVTGALARARARVHAFRESYDRSKPWSKHRLSTFFAQLQEEIDALHLEAKGALEEMRQRFATEVDRSAAGLAARVSTAMALALEKFEALDTAYGDVSSAVDASIKESIGQIDRVPSDADVRGRLDEIQARIDAISDATLKARAQAIFDQLATVAGTVKLDDIKTIASDAVQAVADVKAKALEQIAVATERATGAALEELRAARTLIQTAETAATEFSDEGFGDLQALAEALHTLLSSLVNDARAEVQSFLRQWRDTFEIIDRAVAEIEDWIAASTRLAEEVSEFGLSAMDYWLSEFQGRVQEAEANLRTAVRSEFRRRVVDRAIDELVDVVDWVGDVVDLVPLAEAAIHQFADKAESALNAFETLPLEQIEKAQKICAELAGYKEKLLEGAEDYAQAATAELTAKFELIKGKLEEQIKDGVVDPELVEQIIADTPKLLDAADDITNQIAEAGDHARAYVDQGVEILAQMSEAKPSELPGLALQLVSAFAHSPDIAALRSNAERIRVRLEEAKEILETYDLKGKFNQLGDSLKALGLDFDFSEFGETFKFKVPTGGAFIRNLMPDLGGINLSDMLPNAKIGDQVAEFIRITHDLDTKAGRAWVRADVDVPLPGRETLFAIGPFSLFLRDSRLTAFVRAEASKDQAEVALTDRAVLMTTIEAVVAGQVMVALQDVAITYSSKEQLNFVIDPTKIRIHDTMRFIQDTLGSVFGDEIGGLKFVKEQGVPVGVEHEFTMPPLSLMYGTSGISNLQIANRFSLRAYPDFTIANRFNLSRRELPFLFSIFIIGGTGYIQVDTDYRPFDGQLIVAVEAGAGGSAALAFAFGPVSGGVFVAISVVLRYVKRIGVGPSADDGLSVSLVLLIAGNVSLWGIVTVYLGLMLSMAYHESGRIDGLGQLSVEVRISRWFKLKFSTQVRYKLRDGKTTVQQQSKKEVSGEAYDKLVKKYQKLDNARRSL